MGDDMAMRNYVKSIVIGAGWSFTAVAEELSKKYNKGYTLQNLSRKLGKKTIKHQEILDIAEIIGYEIKWVKKETDD